MHRDASLKWNLWPGKLQTDWANVHTFLACREGGIWKFCGRKCLFVFFIASIAFCKVGQPVSLCKRILSSFVHSRDWLNICHWLPTSCSNQSDVCFHWPKVWLGSRTGWPNVWWISRTGWPDVWQANRAGWLIAWETKRTGLPKIWWASRIGLPKVWQASRTGCPRSDGPVWQACPKVWQANRTGLPKVWWASRTGLPKFWQAGRTGCPVPDGPVWKAYPRFDRPVGQACPGSGGPVRQADWMNDEP